MNCLEFRRRCITEPSCKDEDYIEHKTECKSCNALSAEMDQFENSLKQAVNINPPEDLATHILLKQSLSLEKTYRRAQYALYAMAASILIVLGLTIGNVTTQKQTLEQAVTLEKAVIAYISNELESTQNQSIKYDDIRQLFNTAGLQLNGDFGQINFAEPCYVRDEQSLHISMTGEKGPVTILVMPKDSIDKSITVKNAYFHGIIIPCPKGSMAIIGKPGEELDVIKDRIQEAVTWI